MSEQRIDTGADAATRIDADPGEGLGTGGAAPDRRGATGGDAEMPQPTADRPTGPGADDSADTEGERYLRDTQANQAVGEPSRDGRSGADDGPAREADAPDAGAGGAPAGEVGA